MAKRPRAPKTRNWKAVEITDIIGRPSVLIVDGEVEVTSTNLKPVLSMGRQGINPTILILDLKIVRSGGIGLPVLVYKHATFSKRIRPGQYKEVDIRYRGRIIARIRVRRIPSLRAAAAKKRKKKAKKKAAKKKKKRR